MSLFDRMKTSVKADALGVIDALEDRRLLLRQCVRDAEAELGKKRAHLQALELDLRSIEGMALGRRSSWRSWKRMRSLRFRPERMRSRGIR